MITTKKDYYAAMQEIINHLHSEKLALAKKYKGLDKRWRTQYPNGAPSGYFELTKYEKDWKELRELFQATNVLEVAHYNATQLLNQVSR